VPRAGVGFLGRGNELPPHQLGGLGNSVSSPSGVRGGAPENWDFGAFGDLRNHVRTDSQLLNLGRGGATSESGGTCLPPPT